MYELVKPLYPSVCEAYEDYKLNAVRLSRMEVRLAKEMFGDFIDEWDEYVTDWFDQTDTSPESIKEAEKLLCKKFGLTKRELTEFKEKWL